MTKFTFSFPEKCNSCSINSHFYWLPNKNHIKLIINHIMDYYFITFKHNKVKNKPLFCTFHYLFKTMFYKSCHKTFSMLISLHGFCDVKLSHWCIRLQCKETQSLPQMVSHFVFTVFNSYSSPLLCSLSIDCIIFNIHIWWSRYSMKVHANSYCRQAMNSCFLSLCSPCNTFRLMAVD